MNTKSKEEQILEALDLAIERLEDDHYNTQEEFWDDYGVQYAHERLRFAYDELQKKFKKELR